MSERYAKLFALPENLYTEGSPAIILAGNLLKDNQTGKTLIQLKIKSISEKTIKAVTVLIHALDTAGMPLEGDAEHEYLDLNVNQGEEFGQKTPVMLPNPSTRGFTLEVVKVVFADYSIWTGTDAPWAPLPAPDALDRLGDQELINQFKIHFGGPCQVVPQRHKDLWLCACGAWNRGPKCFTCGKEEEVQLPLNLDALKAERDDRLAREKAAAEDRAKKLKKAAMIAIPVAILCVAAVILVTKVILPNKQYAKAQTLLDAGQYEEAIAAFEALDGYKDSEAQIEAAKAEIAEAKNQADYEAAAALYASGQYEKAAAAFAALKGYRDSAAQAEAAKAAKAEQDRLAREAKIEAENAATYKRAEALLKEGNYEEAQTVFASLKDYKDSQEMGQEAQYQQALSLLSYGPDADREKVAKARSLFEQLGTYKDAEEQLSKFRRVLLDEITKTTKTAKTEQTIDYYYDEYGHKTSYRKTYDSKNRAATYILVYGEDDRLLQDNVYLYTYDNNGLLVEKAERSGNKKTTYSYKVKDDLVLEKTYDEVFIGKTRKIVCKYSYDNAGRLTREDHYYDGKEDYSLYYSYNDEGRLVREESRSSSYWSLTVNTYDDAGHMIRSEKYYDREFTGNYNTNPGYYSEYIYEGNDLVTCNYYSQQGLTTVTTYHYGYIYVPNAPVSGE